MVLESGVYILATLQFQDLEMVRSHDAQDVLLLVHSK